ncbi:MAG: septal ring factor EnvC (AmiA/AmiB activator) [Flavobacteriales bacterium]|jgi:septal ring factor EnvC (AmiA/AmiB activator)
MIVNKVIIALGIALITCISTLGQKTDKKQLQKNEKALKVKIAETANLIKATKENEELTLAELAMINHQIYLREELSSNIDYQLRKVDDEIEDINVQIIQIENNLKVLKEEYIKMLQYAYKNRDTDFELFYIFSAESYQDAYQRMMYIEQYAEYRTKQVEKIKQSKELLAENLIALNSSKDEKKVLATAQETEKSNFVIDQEKQKAALLKLSLNKESLEATLKAQELEKAKVAVQIRKAIQAELDAIKPKSGSNKFYSAPATVKLSKDFSSNKGKLPWPVKKGVITGKYGEHAHPTLPGIIIKNDGIDITTEKNAQITALFSGQVTSIFTIPGAGKVVVVGHGNYKTIYSNLQEVSVNKGDQIKTKDVIGKLLAVDGKKYSIAHVEIRKVKSDYTSYTLNPASWLKK